MKVGLVIYGSIDTVSGGYLYDRKLVAHLRASGDDVRIVSVPPARYVPHLIDNLSFRLPLDLDVIIEDELVHPSVLLCNRMCPPSLPVLSLVHNLHSSERRAAWQNAIFRQIEAAHLRSVDGYIFNSTVTRDAVWALVGDTRPFVLATQAGDRLGSLPSEAIRARAAHAGPLRLLFLANVTPLKGLHVLLDALAPLPADSCTLDIAGSLTVDGAYASRMQRQAESLPLPVRFHGVLDGAPLIDLVSHSDALVIPSYYEGFGISYLEGMAFGLPAIGTTAGAIPYMIRNAVNGYMISPGDSAALSGIITKLAADRALLLRLSLAARETFAEFPTWAASAGLVREFLRQMVGSQH
ncbi:MAG: glycosyltransferase family 4 protein [Anaerolineae bacterium]